VDALALGADEGRSRDAIRSGEVRQPSIRRYPNGETRLADHLPGLKARRTKAGHLRLNI